MIDVLPESHGNILGIKARGKLTHQDYADVLIPRLEAIMQDQTKARVLCDMGEEFDGWELEAMWDDARFGMKHKSDFEKFAVVGGPRWVEWGAKLAALFMSGEVKTFPHDQLEEAWAWVTS